MLGELTTINKGVGTACLLLVRFFIRGRPRIACSLSAGNNYAGASDPVYGLQSHLLVRDTVFSLIDTPHYPPEMPIC